MNRNLALLALSLLFLPAQSALASSSAWFEMEGGSLRLVTTGLADKDGLLRGAIEIELEPGWKTYWRDPGSSGVPPQLDTVRSLNVSGAELHFPAPEWHEDSYGDWAGYGRSVTLPVTFTIPEPDRYSLIEADLFLGICETICVPVQAGLTVEPGSQPEDPGHAQAVETAFASLPSPATDDFGIAQAELTEDELVLKAILPKPAEEAALFIAGSRGYMFGTPVPTGSDKGEAVFTVPVPSRPQGRGEARLSYTLVSGGRAVSGEFVLP